MKVQGPSSHFLAFLFAAMTLAACGGTTRVVTRVSRDDAQGLTVVGVGEADAAPDVARVSVGVETRALSVGEAVAESNRRMESLLETLKAAGIADKDLQTRNYSIRYEEPRERPPEPLPRLEAEPPAGAGGDKGAGPSASASAQRPAEPKGRFVVNNMAQATVRDLDRLGEVLQAATEHGANEVWGISFDIDEPEPLRKKARQLAMQDARAKAEALAALAGVTLGRPVSIRETGSEMPRPVARRAVSLEAAGVPVERGALTVTERVEVVYEIGKDEKPRD